jgi:hypothetical protein
LVDNGWCLAQPGREYVVFQKQAQPFTLEIAGAKSPLSGEWFNPQTGKGVTAGSFDNGAVSFTPPTNWGNAPLVLHLKIISTTASSVTASFDTNSAPWFSRPKKFGRHPQRRNIRPSLLFHSKWMRRHWGHKVTALNSPGTDLL